MGLLDWFQRFSKGEKNLPLEVSKEEQEFAGLDVVAVIDAHLQWRKRLEDYIAGHSSEQLDVSTVMSDDVCVLGKWIHYGPQRFTLSLHPEYAELKEAHRVFHLYASRVVHTFKLKGKAAAQELLQRDFESASQLIQAKLAGLMVKERYGHNLASTR